MKSKILELFYFFVCCVLAAGLLTYVASKNNKIVEQKHCVVVEQCSTATTNDCDLRKEIESLKSRVYDLEQETTYESSLNEWKFQHLEDIVKDLENALTNNVVSPKML